MLFDDCSPQIEHSKSRRTDFFDENPLEAQTDPKIAIIIGIVRLTVPRSVETRQRISIGSFEFQGERIVQTVARMGR